MNILMGLLTFVGILGMGIVGMGVFHLLPHKIQDKIDKFIEEL